MAMAHAALSQIFLVIVLGPVKSRCWCDLGNKWASKLPGSLHLLFGGLGNALLLRRMEEDCGTILCPYIRSLTVQGCRIVSRPEDVKQALIVDLSGIISYLHHLGVPGLIGANVFISRVLSAPAKITNRGIHNTWYLTKCFLDAPKTARAESCSFHDCS